MNKHDDTTGELRFERVNYTVKETGAAIRKALREAFPGVKFSLRGSRGTGYGWFSLSWTNGPTTWAVDEVTNGFRSSYFDGMDDSTRRIEPTMYADPDGVIREHRFTCNGVNSSRDYTDEAKTWARAYVEAHGGADVWNEGIALRDGESLAWRVLQGVDLTGVDMSTAPDPGEDGDGRHRATTYVLEGRFYGGEPIAPRHRADLAARR